jgi:hypothetical protein
VCGLRALMCLHGPAFIQVRYQVLTAANMKMILFWYVTPCSLVEVYRRFRYAHRSDCGGRNTSETSVNFYQTIRRVTFQKTVIFMLSFSSVLSKSCHSCVNSGDGGVRAGPLVKRAHFSNTCSKK